MEAKKTPLYDVHVRNNAKMAPFAGYEMPIQYPLGIIKEHKAVREGVGLFDVSHMGEIRVRGMDAKGFLNHLITSDISKIKPGRIKYGIVCNEVGFALDDILIYCISDTEYLVVVNASNKDKDFKWMVDHQWGDVTLVDESDQTALIAVQGPHSEALMRAMTHTIPEKFYTFIETNLKDNIPCLISRTGYTGEDGFELYLSNDDAPLVWDKLEALGAVCCGLGARDTLRLEAALPLYGHELTESLTPLDAGLNRFVTLDKQPFIGQEALAQSTAKTLIGFEIEGRQIAREGANVYKDEVRVGCVTSGTYSPILEKGIGMAILDPDTNVENLFVEIRGKFIELKTVTLPFIKKGGK